MDLEEEKKRIEWLHKRSEDVTRQKHEAGQLKQEIAKLEEELQKTGLLRIVSDCQIELEELSEKR